MPEPKSPIDVQFGFHSDTAGGGLALFNIYNFPSNSTSANSTSLAFESFGIDRKSLTNFRPNQDVACTKNIL